MRWRMPVAWRDAFIMQDADHEDELREAFKVVRC